MHWADFNFRIKSVDEGQGWFSGLASTYSTEPDLVGDVIAPGAFSQAIARQGPGYPLLYEHQREKLLGLARIEDSRDGLLAHGEIDLADPEGDRIFRKVKMKALRGLSIGFLPSRGKTETRNDGATVLHEVRLFEISLTAVPANLGARVYEVRSLRDARKLLASLDAAHLEEDGVPELKGIETELRRLLSEVEPEHSIDPAVLRDLNQLAVAMRA